MIIETMGRRRAPVTYTKSLFHFDGTNYSTNFIDETGKVWINEGNRGYLLTGSKVFGTASLFVQLEASESAFCKIKYTGNYSDLSLEWDNFTVDFWAWPSRGGFFNNTALNLSVNNSLLYADFYADSVLNRFTADVSGGWRHVAFCRNNNSNKLYIDGVLKSESTTGNLYNASTPYIGYGYGNNSFSRTVGMDELRISSVARWTSDFTPPTSAYTLD